MSNKSEEVHIIKRYSENLKRQVVDDVDSGKMSVREAMLHYDVPYRKTIGRWRSKYGKNQKLTQVVRVVMKDDRERIRELESALAEERLRSRLFETELGIWNKKFPDIKKKLDTNQLKAYEDIQRKRKLLL